MNAPTSAYLIRRGELNPGWIMLYAATLALQLISALVRYFIAYAVIWVPSKLEFWDLPVHNLALLIAFAPLVISLATLVLPLGGWWFEQQAGGRQPSERERIAFDYAFAELAQADPALRPPRRWFVTDDQDPNACVYADTLMVTRGMLDNPFFPAVLAHELGHFNTSDGRLTAALYRLTTPPHKPVRFPFKTLAYLASGRLAMAPVQTAWAIYWRHREMLADDYAANLGQATALETYLDTHALDGDLPTPFKTFGRTSHPWTEHRIDRLQARSPNG
jgi:Zn-dependent protease with chaperone function